MLGAIPVDDHSQQLATEHSKEMLTLSGLVNLTHRVAQHMTRQESCFLSYPQWMEAASTLLTRLRPIYKIKSCRGTVLATLAI